MAWMYLLAAGLLEIVWAYTMKLSQGFSRPGPTALTILVMLASFALLSLAMKTLPLGTAYTVWTGIGAVGAFIVGVVVLGEPLTMGRLVAAGLIVTGLSVMKLSTAA
jgi:quaternary ammonium compound-resistance protein SugE